jgi:GNAT superfamily N-acetyltransferase
MPDEARREEDARQEKAHADDGPDPLAVEANGLGEELSELQGAVDPHGRAERYPRRIEIRRESYGSAAVRALAEALAAELLRSHGRPGSGSEPPASDFEPPGGAFLVGSVDGTDVACGGVCRYDGETAEIRRMYVAPAVRGRGFSRTVLGALEDEARALGYARIRLETGIRQTAAIGLYRSAGFEPIERYGPYVDDELSVCFEKRL